MTKTIYNIPENWPEAFKKPFRMAMDKAGNKQKRDHIHAAANKHLAFCQAEALPILSYDAIVRHHEFLRNNHKASIAQRNSVCIAQIAWCIADKTLRDQLYDHFLDMRSKEELFSEPYLPRELKFIGKTALDEGEFKLQDWRFFDRYLRVLDRLGTLPNNSREIVDAFWFKSPSYKQQSAILGKVADLIDLLTPGNGDANRLRKAQRYLREINVPVKLKAMPEPYTNPEITQLVDAARQIKGKSVGAPYSDKKKENQRAILQILEQVLNDAGQDFSLKRDEINIFADHANLKFEIGRMNKLKEKSSEEGWTANYISHILYTIATFISDKQLCSDVKADAGAYSLISRKSLKRKDLILLKNPITLPELFEKAFQLLQQADDAPIESRHRSLGVEEAFAAPETTRPLLIIVAAILALLCFYPLRGIDIVGLRFGYELQRDVNGWLMVSLPTHKTGWWTDPIRFPAEMSPFLDAAILQGSDSEHLWPNYKEKKGHYLWGDWKTGEKINRNDLTIQFKKLVGYTPHLLRTLWADYLLINGADRNLVSAMLQHSSLISQQDYEALVKKVRVVRTAETLAGIANQALER
ncbi:hypothetical protein [uncultured Cohaesibacter sp.]|uniref:hypothetical protein n=1 Tax=uncultured Cohaesibacter sp. TaxID=1002546 RepID=UPI0029C79262|nr:hypothetical protein [uncultured Cohaesibacter sp.]